MINRIFKLLRNYFKINYINNSILAKVDKSTILQNGTSMRFDAGHDLREYLNIGERCLINSNFIFESRNGYISIGNNVNIGGADLISREQIIIGNDVTMAWGITIYDHNSHSINWYDRSRDNEQCYNDFVNFGNSILNKNWDNVKSDRIVIHDKVWIGFDVLILKGVVIGEGAVIGAKSVVTKDVPAWTVCAGNPAKVVKYLK